MHYFLDPDFEPEKGELNEAESRHAIKSLRLVEGDQIAIGDGGGNLFSTRIRSISKSSLEVDILEAEFREAPKPKLTIAIAPTKSPSRFEWFLEKATELGADEIIPIMSQRSERPRFKTDRALRILLAATKQCRRAHLPVLKALTPFSEMLTTESPASYIAYCETDTKRMDFVEAIRESDSEHICILIGPEGDFTDDEVREARARGFQPVQLGANRLRTETAGVFAAAAVYGIKKS